ncbi:MAG: ester cyclase [Chloroflexi bacterium]|nr:MAG: ester cyclase [Chloroflexota bacterium]
MELLANSMKTVQKGNSPMSTEENKTLIRRAYEEGFNQRNLAVLDEVDASDFVVHNASTTMQGLEAFKQFLSLYLTAFSDAHFTIEDIIAEGDSVVARHTFSGTQQGDLMGIAPTGKQVMTTGITITRFANGKGVELWGNNDDLGLLQQLGVVPTMG